MESQIQVRGQIHSKVYVFHDCFKIYPFNFYIEWDHNLVKVVTFYSGHASSLSMMSGITT